jgi:hypothetical protein
MPIAGAHDRWSASRVRPIGLISGGMRRVYGADQPHGSSATWAFRIRRHPASYFTLLLLLQRAVEEFVQCGSEDGISGAADGAGAENGAGSAETTRAVLGRCARVAVFLFEPIKQ